MKTPRAFVALLTCVVFSGPLGAADSVTTWPENTRENKPWTRWWWPGSGVDAASLTANLKSFQDAGLGGVEITPIYGAKGYEARYIDFLSPKWMQMSPMRRFAWATWNCTSGRLAFWIANCS